MRNIKTMMFYILLVFCVGGCSGQPLVGQKAKLNYVNQDHVMEHVTFNGGYLRKEPEQSTGNITSGLIRGSRGLLYGKRRINGKEWGKVTTREGLTGWYTPVEENKGENTYLKVDKRNYQQSYPEVGGIKEEAARFINQEIAAYLEVFNYVVGPVGSGLQCRVTFNDNKVLSIVFTAAVINYRTYPLTAVQDEAQWKKINTYAALSPLMAMATSQGLTAKSTDLQYAMTFSLTTGKRLTLQDFGLTSESVKAAVVDKLGVGSQVDGTNFYLTEQGQLVLLAQQGDPSWERRRVYFPLKRK